MTMTGVPPLVSFPPLLPFLSSFLSEAPKAIGILEACGEKASVIGKVTDQPGVNIILQ